MLVPATIFHGIAIWCGRREWEASRRAAAGRERSGEQQEREGQDGGGEEIVEHCSIDSGGAQKPHKSSVAVFGATYFEVF